MSTATKDRTEDLRAYHGDEALKQETIAEARMHREAGTLVKDSYYRSDGKEACAVGCLTKNPNGGHAEYPELFGVPTWMAYLEEGIFVALPADKAMLWPERFLSAIPAGADFDGLADRLAIRRLKEECLSLSGTWPDSVKAEVVASIELTIAALEGKKSLESARSAAWSAAWSAARSAARSARSAEFAAESAAESAWFAAESAWFAAKFAWFAAKFAWFAAESAAESAESAARSAEFAAESARSAAYEREADRLIAELEALPVPEVAAA